ncbi:MAG: hypothetical protein KBT27_11310 [Prevotellaceae bacterium]|nr:hypothetical protein [Candidatus Faecinaster equi]
MAQGIFINCTINELVQSLHVSADSSVMTEAPASSAPSSWVTPSLPAADVLPQCQEASFRAFDFLIRGGHCQQEIDSVMERLRIRCAADSAYALMRLLRELDQSHYVLLSDARGPQEVYNSLRASFPMPTITLQAFRSAWKEVK